jgi:predicted Zn-ribbon and HTH transcriptional regulator
MTELTRYLRTLAGDVNPEQLNHLVFLCKGLESVPQYLESALDIFRMFTYGGKMRRLQFYLHDISEVIGLHADPQKLEEYGIPKKDVAVPDFSPKYLFHRCLTQIALTMNADDVTQMFAEFIRTWDGIQYDKYSTALDLFRILISRNIVGPTKVEVLSNVMGYVSSMCKHRHFIETYLKATHTHVIQEQVYPTVSLPSAEVESLLKKFQNLLQHNATAEMYKMREIEHPFCEKCSYEQKLSRCPKCPTTEIQYRGIAQVFSNFSPELVDNYDEIYCKRFLNKLGYYVYVNQNCVLTEFDAILSRRREEYKRHAEYDSFVCCVTSKGDNGKILDSEGKICNPSHLMSHFSDDMCPNLKGKPRVFLVQTYSKHSSSPLLLPSPQLDCLYVCHVLPVEYQRKGSLFIRALRGIVQKCGAYSDLMSMLTKVNQYIAESESSESVYVPVIVSHLQKLICFPSRVP